MADKPCRWLQGNETREQRSRLLLWCARGANRLAPSRQRSKGTEVLSIAPSVFTAVALLSV